MANSKLIKERNLDPELLAKILSSGSSVDVQGVLKDYVKKTDKIEKKQLGDTVIAYIEDMAGQGSSGLGSYYRKGETIDINDIPQSLISDVSNATASAEKANKALENVSQTISDEAATKVNEYIQNADIINTTYKSVKKELDETYQPRFNTYDEQIPDLIKKINTNSATIASVQERYRRKDELITYDDLDADVTNKFEQEENDITSLSNTKQDKIYGQPGDIIYMNSNGSPIGTSCYVKGNFVNTDIELEEGTRQHITPIIDLRTDKQYRIKFNEWNYNASEKTDDEGVLNSTVSDSYTRYTFSDANYIISDASKITTDEQKYFAITTGTDDTNETVFTIGFWGTCFKLNGKINKKTEATTEDTSTSTSPTANLNISLVMDRYDTYYFSNIGSQDLDAACLFSIADLSEGRHRIDITIPKGITLQIEPYVDLDKENSSVLLKADIMDARDYRDTWDTQDTWITVPSIYTTVKKSTTLFDPSKMSSSDYYTTNAESSTYEDDNTVDTSKYANKILISNISRSFFLLTTNNDNSNSSVTTLSSSILLSRIIDDTTTSFTFQLPNILRWRIRIFKMNTTDKTFLELDDATKYCTFNNNTNILTVPKAKFQINDIIYINLIY